MPSRVVYDDDEQQIADLLHDVRRLQANMTTTSVKGSHDEFTAAATPATTYTLTTIPLTGTCMLALNGHVQREGTDYTVDYDTGIATVTATQASGDKLTFRYLVTDWLVARSLTPDTGTITDSFNRANSTTTPNPASDGGAWTTDAQRYGISSNQLTAGGAGWSLSDPEAGANIAWGNQGSVCRRDTGQVAADVTVDFLTSDGFTAYGQILVSANPTTTHGYYLRIHFSAPHLTVLRAAPGPSTVLGSATLPTGGGGFAFPPGGPAKTIRFTHDGAGVFNVYVDGSLVLTCSDGTPLTGLGTWVGLSANTNDFFDNFSAATA